MTFEWKSKGKVNIWFISLHTLVTSNATCSSHHRSPSLTFSTARCKSYTFPRGALDHIVHQPDLFFIHYLHGKTLPLSSNSFHSLFFFITFLLIY